MGGPALQQSSSEQSTEALGPLSASQSEGRTALETRLRNDGVGEAKLKLFLGTIDQKAARSSIYEHAAKGNFKPGLEAFGIAERSLDAAMAEAIRRQTQLRLAGTTTSATDGSTQTQATLPPASLSTQPASSGTTSSGTVQDRPTKVDPELGNPPPAIESAFCRVEFHRPENSASRGCSSIVKTSQELRLNPDGSLEMRVKGPNGEATWAAAKEQPAGVALTCLYVHEGKVFTRTGAEVKALQWGVNTSSATHVTQFLNPIEPGKVSGVRDGYLKDVRFNGAQAVFSKGPPPGLLEAQSKQPPTTTSNGTTKQTLPGNGAATVVEPTLPRLPTQPVETLPTTTIAFASSDSQNIVSSVSQTLRLTAEGKLEVKVGGQNSSATWLEADGKNATPAVSCLFHHQGKVYTAQGKEVTQLSWAGRPTDSAFLLKYVGQLEPGKVSGMQANYLNDVKLNGTRVVFTEGLPPALRQSAKTSETVDTTRPPTTAAATTTTVPGRDSAPANGARSTAVAAGPSSTVSIAVQQAGGTYYGGDVQFRRGADGSLEVGTGQGRWSPASEHRQAVGQARDVQFELLYYHNGKLLDAKGTEVESLQYGDRTIAKSGFEASIMQYTAQRNDGAIYGMKSGVLNDIRSQGRQVVFVNGAPPGRP